MRGPNGTCCARFSAFRMACDYRAAIEAARDEQSARGSSRFVFTIGCSCKHPVGESARSGIRPGAGRLVARRDERPDSPALSTIDLPAAFPNPAVGWLPWDTWRGLERGGPRDACRGRRGTESGYSVYRYL